MLEPASYSHLWKILVSSYTGIRYIDMSRRIARCGSGNSSKVIQSGK